MRMPICNDFLFSTVVSDFESFLCRFSAWDRVSSAIMRRNAKRPLTSAASR